MNKNTTNVIKVFDKYASEYQTKYMDVSPYHESLNVLCSTLSESDSILEVACGPGNITKYILSVKPELDILSTELSQNMLNLAKKNNPTVSIQLLNAKHITSLNKKFNCIIAGFCLPYFSKQEAIQFIEDSKNCLLQNGLLYISLMEGENSNSQTQLPSSGEGPGIFINYHERSYITQSMEENGFDLLYSKTQPYDYGQNNKGNDLIIIGKRKNGTD